MLHLDWAAGQVRIAQATPVQGRAHGLLAEAGADPDREDWEVARDEAVLTLLWGCGLRISEALSLRQSDAPIPETKRRTTSDSSDPAKPQLTVATAKKNWPMR